jgi:hypothetical protein
MGKMVQIAEASSKQVKVADSEKAVNSLGSAPGILRPIDAEPWQDEHFGGPPERRIRLRARGGEGTVAQGVQRWVEVTPSQFTHEAEGLNLVRSLLPANAPFRAWSNFEFRDGHGKWHEVDLLVLGRRRLHLVELKYYSGTLRGDDLTWRRDGHRAEDSPLKLARRKAQRLAGKLQDELIRWAQETGANIPDTRTVVPFVQESVFLHHPGLRCLLPRASRVDLFGLDGAEGDSGLPGLSGRLLEPATPHESVGVNREEIIAALIERTGIVLRRQREAGSWVIDEAGFSPGGHDRPGPDPVPGHAAGRDGDRTGQDPPGRRARVPDHVAAGERPAAAPPGHGRQRARGRAGLPAGRTVPATGSVAG